MMKSRAAGPKFPSGRAALPDFFGCLATLPLRHIFPAPSFRIPKWIPTVEKRICYSVALCVLMVTISGWSFAQKKIYVSPFGSDSSSGLEAAHPLRTLQAAIPLASPGDEIRLLPGTYPGRVLISGLNGLPEKPVTLLSDATDTSNFAVIDGGSAPGNNLQYFAFSLSSSSWLVFKNLNVRNCWTDVMPISGSAYISVIGCDFLGGRRVVYPMSGSHHILVENCRWEQNDSVWTTFDWTAMHDGALSYYNGALFHPYGGRGPYVMRGCVIKNVFNGFRSKPSAWNQDANIEVYNNVFMNVADNSFEPEQWAWNVHFYHNILYNNHKAFSIDGVQGGPVYVYGNIYWQSTDANAIDKVSGIWKFKTGPLTYPCYAFNNSFYTEAQAFKSGEATNTQMKHFNNAYFFFQGSARMGLYDWDSTFEFDNDCINQTWPVNIVNNNQEMHGLDNTDAQFVNGAAGDFRLQPGSPCIGKGKVMSFPEFEWTEGIAPPVGAFDGDQLVDGPPFRFRVPPGGVTIPEKPRIVRHKILGDTLVVYFSVPVDAATVSPSSIHLSIGHDRVGIVQAVFPHNAYEMMVVADRVLQLEGLALRFDPLPVGVNGQAATHWASTIPLPDSPRISDAVRRETRRAGVNSLRVLPNSLNLMAQIEYTLSASGSASIRVYDLLGRELRVLVDGWHNVGTYRATLNMARYGSGVYFIRLVSRGGISVSRLLITK